MVATALLAGAIAVTGIVGGAAVLGQINQLIQILFSNFATILFGGIVVTGLYIAYKSANDIEHDVSDYIGVFSIVVGLFIAWLFIFPTVSTELYGYNAEVEVTVKNPVFDQPQIEHVEVNNIERGGKLSVLDVPGISGTYSGDVVVDCDGSKSRQSFGISVIESQTSSTVVEFSGLQAEEGTTCTMTTTLSDNGNQIDSFQSSFTLGDR